MSALVGIEVKELPRTPSRDAIRDVANLIDTCQWLLPLVSHDDFALLMRQAWHQGYRAGFAEACQSYMEAAK